MVLYMIIGELQPYTWISHIHMNIYYMIYMYVAIFTLHGLYVKYRTIFSSAISLLSILLAPVNLSFLYYMMIIVS